jgi:transcription factor E
VPSAKKIEPKVKTILLELGGPEAVTVARELQNVEEEITDDQLQAISKVRLNDVRRILYILYEAGLADFRRVRDKKSGWFIYFWRATLENIDTFIKQKREAVLQRLAMRLNYEEENMFFQCDQLVPLETPLQEPTPSVQGPGVGLRPPSFSPSNSPALNQQNAEAIAQGSPADGTIAYEITDQGIMKHTIPERIKFDDAASQNFRCMKCGRGKLDLNDNRQVKTL